MGNLGSAPRQEDDIWWTNGQSNINSAVAEENISETSSPSQNQVPQSPHDISLNHLSETKLQDLNDFKFDMERKQDKRREILDAKRKQFEDLREEVRRLTEENEELKNGTAHVSKTKEIEQLQQENEHMRLLLSTKQSGGVLMEELDKVIRENTMLRGELKDKVEELSRVATLLDKNRELRINIAEMQEELQGLNSVVVDFETEREEYKAHVIALKDVISVSKKMLLIRESQLKELREKVESIEESLSGKEMNILSQDLRIEYERQLQSIRNLRAMYEERQRSDYREREELKKLLAESKKDVEIEQNKNKEAEERISELEELNSQKYDQIKTLESNFGLAKAESRQFQAELTVINQLFSEILLGFNSSQEIDLDKLTKHLEDNHALLQNIVSNELTSESSSALPKVLLDLVHQIHNEEENKPITEEEHRDGHRLETIVEESESQNSTDQINSVEEIVELLPKVWRVLIELLSHHKVPPNNLHEEESTNVHPCYKTVQTPKGPSLVLSVSQTFIRLKDLILEKKSLEKETGHLKQLNTHLETRLQDQEKRLGKVSNELNKTWHVVGKLQKEHQLLHTQEKILRYELAQKRKLLTTLREELEYSRGKWQEAKEKNSKTEKQWRQLKGEFAARRNTVPSDEYNNSQESGYSDERCSSSDDEPGYETDISECAPKPDEESTIIEDDNVTSELLPECAPRADEESTTIEDDNGTSELLSTETTAPNEDQRIPIPTAEELASENTIQSRVTMAEDSIEQSNAAINSKLDINLSKDISSTNETTCTNIQDTSSRLVSSVIEEAVASILGNSSSVDSEGRLTYNENTECDIVPQRSDVEPEPSTSTSAEPKKKTLEELLAAKEERLKRLEGQCGQLMNQVNSTTQKSVMISNKLDDLHEVYGDRSESQSTSSTEKPSPSSVSTVEENLDNNETNNQE